jgi:predicted benzoate:H+ symporter BenE
MSFQWLLFLHITSVLALLGTHGTSMTVLYRIRRERDRARILGLVTLSGETILPMYISLAAIVVTGVLLAFKVKAFSRWWLWVAIVILVVVAALMGMIARPYFARVKEACQLRPSGVPRVSDEELAEILQAPTVHVISAIGGVGLLAILYLMIFQPH